MYLLDNEVDTFLKIEDVSIFPRKPCLWSFLSIPMSTSIYKIKYVHVNILVCCSTRQYTYLNKLCWF